MNGPRGLFGFACEWFLGLGGGIITSMSREARMFLLTVAAGAGVGLLFDVFRAFRKVFRHPNFLTQAEDTLFWLLAIIGVSYTLLSANMEMRFFSFIGMALGALVYFLGPSHAVRAVLGAVLGFVKRVVIMAARLVTAPFRALFRLIGKFFSFLASLARKPARAVKKSLQNVKMYAKIKQRKIKDDITVIRKKV